VLQSGPCFSRRISVWSTQSLAEYWSPTGLMEHWKSVSLNDIPHFISQYIEWPASYPVDPVHLSVHESPFEEGLYTIWVYFRSEFKTTDCTILVSKYRLSLGSTSDASRPSCLQIFTTRVEGCANPTGDISYSGHTHIFDCVRRVQRVWALPELHAATNDTNNTVELRDVGDHVHVSTYSGALTYSTHKAIFVNYYL